ncbi:GNAT family N-acetyltransferase [uncultured Faecalicoccus sp.]|uniref:GNAT family N-acetyltransferase n=1 Tax=uncultured Faecalicoccus sp. TaxID=1971760 RepID=UPI0025EDF62C|nr:GNAT family N-acetyltransferase [uncultured Faecalicoccus sp.]
MELYYKETTTKDPQILDLYLDAFPPKERVPYADLLRWPGSHLVGVYADPEHTKLAGMIDCLDYKGICQVRYLAIDPAFRSHGLGSQILAWIKEEKKESIIAIDVESDQVECDNLDQRKRRKAFYYRNGFVDSPDSYRWNGDVFEILVANGTLQPGTFVALWKELFASQNPNEKPKRV